MSSDGQTQDFSNQNGSLQALFNSLQAVDNDERRMAALALGKLRDVRAAAPLIYALNDPEAIVAQSIREALIYFGADAADPLMAIIRAINSSVEDYIDSLEKSNSWKSRKGFSVSHLVWDNWSFFGLKENETDLNQLLSGELKLMKLEAGKVTEVNSNPMLTNLRYVKISRMISEILAELGSVAHKSLLRYLDDRATLVRWVAVRALKGIKTNQVTDGLCSILNDPILIVRETALVSLSAPARNAESDNEADQQSQRKAAEAVVACLLYGKIDSSRRAEVACNLINFGDLALAPLGRVKK